MSRHCSSSEPSSTGYSNSLDGSSTGAQVLISAHNFRYIAKGLLPQ